MLRRWTSLLPLATVVCIASAQSGDESFVPGAVCNGVDMNSTIASEMLRGRHLHVRDAVWAPFAFKDESSVYGWRGFDIDLITLVAERLGFTFEVHEMQTLPGENTWTQMLYRVAPASDLVLSYWARLPERLDRVVMLSGHVDMSATLVGRMEDKVWELHEIMFSSFKPFSSGLWLGILCMILCAGVVDWLLERRTDRGAGLSASMYEYLAGALWGGFEYPKSLASAIYQIVLAFIILVVISAYTANLAAFLTVSAGSTMSIASIDNAIAADSPPTICSYHNPLLSRVDNVYRRLQYITHDSNVLVADELAGVGSAASCDAAIVPKITYDIWRTQSAYCHLRSAETIFAASAGWATNRHSPCVALAVEWALSELAASGDLDRLQMQWLTETTCSPAQDLLTQAGTRRRILQDNGAAPASMPGVPGVRRGRSLRGGDAAAAAGGADEQVRTLTAMDFCGPLLLFLSVTFIVVCVNELQVRFQLADRVVACFSSPKDDEVEMSSPEKAHAAFDIININTDNEAANVVTLLRQMCILRQEIHTKHDEMTERLERSLQEVELRKPANTVETDGLFKTNGKEAKGRRRRVPMKASPNSTPVQNPMDAAAAWLSGAEYDDVGHRPVPTPSRFSFQQPPNRNSDVGHALSPGRRHTISGVPITYGAATTTSLRRHPESQIPLSHIPM